MKKNLVIVLSALVAAFALAGCNDLSTPEAALGSAFKAIKKNKLGAFKATLSGDALAQYGNAEGLKALATQLSGLKVSLGNKQYLWNRRVSHRHDRYSYSLDILVKAEGQATESRFKTAFVVCDWHAGRVYPGRGQYDPGTDLPETTECKIDELK